MKVHSLMKMFCRIAVFATVLSTIVIGAQVAYCNDAQANADANADANAEQLTATAKMTTMCYCSNSYQAANEFCNKSLNIFNSHSNPDAGLYMAGSCHRDNGRDGYRCDGLWCYYLKGRVTIIDLESEE